MTWRIIIPLFVAIFAVATVTSIPGGVEEVSKEEDNDAQEALDFAVGEHNKAMDDDQIRAVIRVVRASKQVVAGIKYSFILMMGRTDCKKDVADQVCGVYGNLEQAMPYQCTFTVLSGLDKSKELLEETCD